MKLKGINLLLIAVLLMSGCETMQPMVDVATAVGVASGQITQSQADSISRSTKAVAKTFEDITSGTGVLHRAGGRRIGPLSI